MARTTLTQQLAAANAELAAQKLAIDEAAAALQEMRISLQTSAETAAAAQAAAAAAEATATAQAVEHAAALAAAQAAAVTAPRNIGGAGVGNEQPAELIPKPPSHVNGVATNLRAAMGVEWQDLVDIRYAIQRNVHSAGLNWHETWHHQDKQKLALCLQVSAKDFPILNTYTNGWATAWIVKEYMKNMRRNARVKGYIPRGRKHNRGGRAYEENAVDRAAHLAALRARTVNARSGRAPLRAAGRMQTTAGPSSEGATAAA
ncbi:uncharacterized protein BXZ73DRAFT_98792 [Epithele typhae]|uniref:uncharacterized protein n=1 Tax=Epithele typhae TaxID=378194 RepID=UPI0020073450|nr:uncharacterized protein BXZ73DRAFT_98792 [Epithele typhae]KAH9940351.1 hypothetical protein BXZ73DRAFT_98792 [Epithele typhae]